MSPVLYLLLFITVANCACWGNQRHREKFDSRPSPPLPLSHSWSHNRFRRAALDEDAKLLPEVEKKVDMSERFRRYAIDEGKLISDNQNEVEVVTDEQMIRSVQEQQLPEGEYEEIPTQSEVGSRAKRATVTIIRIRNRRTGRVTYIIIRRK